MLTDDELELRDRLSRVLGQVNASPPPVAVVLRKGRIMRVGHKVTTGVAIIAIGAACAAAFTGLAAAHRTPPAKPVRQHHWLHWPKETVTKLAATARNGVIATGDESGPHGFGHWRLWADAKSDAIYERSSGGPTWLVGSLKHSVNTNAIGTAYSANAEAVSGLYLVVSPRVTRVSVRYDSGQSVSLYPVKLAGRHWVGELSGLMGVQEYTAYQGHKVLAWAVGSHGPVTWLRPGQRGPGRVTKRIGSGFMPLHSREPWHAWVQAGPWGYCFGLYGMFAGSFNGTCMSPAAVRSAGLKVLIHGIPRWRATYYLGTAEPAVSYLKVRLASGSPITVPVASVDAQRFYAFALVLGQTAVSWGAYNQAGHELYGGTGAPDLATHHGPESISGFVGYSCIVPNASSTHCEIPDRLQVNWRT